jgi:hypothetical protein
MDWSFLSYIDDPPGSAASGVGRATISSNPMISEALPESSELFGFPSAPPRLSEARGSPPPRRHRRVRETKHTAAGAGAGL